MSDYSRNIAQHTIHQIYRNVTVPLMGVWDYLLST